jgi:hypothetical protein
MADDSETGIKIYLREIMQTPLLTAQHERELAARIKKGDQKARAWMIKANLRLVVKIAHDYSNLGLPLLDWISEGNIGLMKAVKKGRIRIFTGHPLDSNSTTSWLISRRLRRFPTLTPSRSVIPTLHQKHARSTRWVRLTDTTKRE